MGGGGGSGGDAFKLMSGSWEGTSAVLEAFFPKRCSRLRLLPVRALGGVAGSGGCFTILMCNVFGGSFWGVGRGSGGKLSN